MPSQLSIYPVYRSSSISYIYAFLQSEFHYASPGFWFFLCGTVPITLLLLLLICSIIHLTFCQACHLPSWKPSETLLSPNSYSCSLILYLSYFPALGLYTPYMKSSHRHADCLLFSVCLPQLIISTSQSTDSTIFFSIISPFLPSLVMAPRFPRAKNFLALISNLLASPSWFSTAICNPLIDLMSPRSWTTRQDQVYVQTGIIWIQDLPFF